MGIEQMHFKSKQNTIYAIDTLVVGNSVTDCDASIENLFKQHKIDRIKISLV